MCDLRRTERAKIGASVQPDERVHCRESECGQAVIELAIQIPLMLVILFGFVQIARVYYIYHMLESALRGGAAMLARSANVNYCDAADPALAEARNFIVYGNLQGEGNPIVPGLTSDMILIWPERSGGAEAGPTTVGGCSCAQEANGCDLLLGGRAPDFVTVNLGGGFPLPVPFPFVNIDTISLRVSVRMPVTGG